MKYEKISTDSQQWDVSNSSNILKNILWNLYMLAIMRMINIGDNPIYLNN